MLSWFERYFPGHQLRSVEVGLEPPDRFPEFCTGVTRTYDDGQRARAIITMPADLPEFLMLETLAHEYGHVALAVESTTFEYLGDPPLSNQLHEGFCEVLRWRWIIDCSAEDREIRVHALQTNQAADYRLGFGLVHAMWSASGCVREVRSKLLASV